MSSTTGILLVIGWEFFEAIYIEQWQLRLSGWDGMFEDFHDFAFRAQGPGIEWHCTLRGPLTPQGPS